MGAIRRELDKRRQARAARSTEQGIAGHQAAMGALRRINKDVTAKNEAVRKDPWSDIHGAGSDYRTAVFSKDSEGNTFMNNVRKIRGGSKEKNNGN